MTRRHYRRPMRHVKRAKARRVGRRAGAHVLRSKIPRRNQTHRGETTLPFASYEERLNLGRRR